MSNRYFVGAHGLEPADALNQLSYLVEIFIKNKNTRYF
jgi:hypothetical protein